ncbi:MAG: hypothetical protein PHG24_02975, partial [Candidatus Pacebacteria bacterium]|nr:hypothetical protein [Candidatus Paceibacterota bacterium]
GEEEKIEKMDDFSHKGNERYYELVDEYNRLKEEIGESQPLTKEQKLTALEKLINERMEEIDREGIDLHYDGDVVYYGLVDKYNKLMEEVGAEAASQEIPQPITGEVNAEAASQEIPVSQSTAKENKPERSAILKNLIDERLNEVEREGNLTIQIDEYGEIVQPEEEINLKAESQEFPASNSVVEEAKLNEGSSEGENVEKVINTLDEMDKETSVEVAELSPEKGSLFNRLKESFKNKENQKKALIFATALAVGTAVPFASMVYFGGGFFGIGAGASIPILKMVGIASKSAYLGGPLGGALIGLATKKMLDFGFAKAENNGREMSEDEMKTLIKNVDEAMKKVNVEDLNKTWKNS